jgi:predicted nucleic acid-binding protein
MATQPLGQQERGIRSPLLDSDIVIWILRGDEPMVQFYNQLVESFGQNLAVSVVTVYEVLAGMRPEEEQRTKEFLGKLKCLPVTEEIAEKAAEYYRAFRAKGQTLHIADLLIAATAFCHELPLATLNQDDFPMTDITFWQKVPSPPPNGKPRRAMSP